MKAKQIVAVLLEAGPDEVNPKSYLTDVPTSDEEHGIRRIGSQTRQNIKFTDYEVVRKLPGQVILRDKTDQHLEIWYFNNHHAGYTLEIGGRGYEFGRDLQPEQLRPLLSTFPFKRKRKFKGTRPKAMMMAVTGGTTFPIAGGGQG